MNCAAPGCPNPPGEELVRVKARPAIDFEGMRAVALVRLCPEHLEEFRKLGWLDVREDEEPPERPACGHPVVRTGPDGVRTCDGCGAPVPTLSQLAEAAAEEPLPRPVEKLVDRYLRPREGS